MSGVVSVGAALGATALAASSVASVGITVGSAFAIVGAVGATLGVVGTITKVKELQYAGAALGAVGLVGGLASAAGLFGEAGALFGAASDLAGVAAGTTAAETASPFVSAASGIDAGTWAGTVAAPMGGYENVGALMEGQGIVAGEIPGFDAIDMVNGIPQVNTGQVTTPTAAAPDVTPTAAADTMVDGKTAWFDQPKPSLEFESPTKGFDTWANGGDVPAPPQTPTAPDISQVNGRVPDPAKSLLDMGGNQSVLPQDFGYDNAGNMIPQGGGEGGTLGIHNNPAAPPTSSSPKPTGLVDAQPAATTTSASTQMPLSDMGGAQSAASGSAPSWTTNVTGKPTAGLTADASPWQGITDWIQKNQTLSFGAMQAIGSFITGALKPGTDPAVIDELNSRSAQNKAAENLYMQQAAMLQRRMQNMSEVPTAIRAPRPLASYGGGVTGRVG